MTIDPAPHSRCTLDVAIAPHTPEGIQRVAAMDLPVIDGVSYIVSWQDHRDTPIPPVLNRTDLKIIRYDKYGQSLNRNNAFDHCSADIILCSDDDLIYDINGLVGIIETFSAHPELDLATFHSNSPHAENKYPIRRCPLRIPLPKNYYVACYEIAFRRTSAQNLRCHPKLGLGSPDMHGGEDELLLLSAIRRGLNCQYIPAMGCIIALTYPVSCILRLPLKAWRIHRRGQSSLPKALLYLASGALRAPFLFPDKKYLW